MNTKEEVARPVDTLEFRSEGDKTQTSCPSKWKEWVAERAARRASGLGCNVTLITPSWCFRR